MPIYEFFCMKCNRPFDVLCPIKTDLSTIVCPDCKGGNVKKKVSAFAKSPGNRLGAESPTEEHHSAGTSCSSCNSGSCSTCGH